MQVCITGSALAAMITAARDAHPREACGLLLGDEATISTAQATANRADRPEHRFEIDPAALIDAHRAERAGGPALLGYFHSHPNGCAKPSATDATLAAHDGRIWAIVARDTVTLWRDVATGFEPLSYHVLAS